MTFHFIQLKLGSKTYKDQVSTEGCTYVADFRCAIKNKFSPYLDSYAPYQFTLFQPDGTTEIDPATLVADLKEIPWSPLAVTVEELPIQTPAFRSRKQSTYKGMSTEASCRKLLDALAVEISCFYDFRIAYKKPTMGDVLAAKDTKQGRPSQPLDETGRPILWWDYNTRDGIPCTTTPLPSFLSVDQWNLLQSLNQDTNNRIHDAQLPRTSTQKPFVVLPHSSFTSNKFVDTLKSIAELTGLITAKDELIVKDELDLSAS